MASIRHVIAINASAYDVWDAVRDFGALDRRLVPGFVTECTLEGDTRVVTFANGTVARELLVDCDDEDRRLVYAIQSERVRHYNASVEVIPEHEARCRMVWVIDVLPHEIAPYIREQTKLAMRAIYTAFPPA